MNLIFFTLSETHSNTLVSFTLITVHVPQGMAFTLKERQIMGIHGLLPPTVFTQEEQAIRIVNNFHHWQHDLDKYIYLTALQDRNEKLFYKVTAILAINLNQA